MPRPHILFVTGKLAEPALRRILVELGPRAGFDFTVAVLPITVAALATTSWIARHLDLSQKINRVILPGLCAGLLEPLLELCSVPVERGPADLRDLPEFFGADNTTLVRYGAHDIEILAEINHVARLGQDEIMAQADLFRSHGADIIDLGCDPGETWSAARATVNALRADGFRVSIDSFNPAEVEAALAGGAELVLSVNSSNRERAATWGCEVVVLPDTASNLEGVHETVACLRESGVPFRIDPIIEPIGFGFAASLGRYLEVRRRYPDAEILMGVGNLTELTDVDSAGMNVALLGFCQEVGIRSVLTTEVINWCRSSVRELDLARRLVYHACQERVLPKRLEPNLVVLRDPKLREFGREGLLELSRHVKDRNFRLFAEGGRIFVFNGNLFLEGTDPFSLLEQIQAREPLDPSHAFYLGYEMAKAVTALTLGKNYVQDQALNWGFLTVPEQSHRGTIEESG